MRRTYGFDGDGKLVEKWRGTGPGRVTIMTDAYSNTPTRSPVDGTVIGSRRELRGHNRRNGVLDVGNDSTVRNPKRPPIDPTPGVTEATSRAFAEHGA